MINFNSKQIKMWESIGIRATFGKLLYEICEKKKNIFVITGDVSTSAGLDRFKKKFKSNYIDVGIAEQNMIGVAAGLSATNKKIFTTTFSPFQTLRCCEQIKVNLSYMKSNVCMVGLASGISLGILGYTHCSIEDIGVLRSMPNITIISPSDTTELAKSILQIIKHDKPVYLRLTGNNKVPIVNKKNYKFKIGKGIQLVKGRKIAIISNGTIINECISSINVLNKKKIYPSLYNFHTIKPIDEGLILKISKNYDFIFTVEEHNVIGGLGSSISEVLSKISLKIKLIKMGIIDQYTSCGNREHMLKANKIDKESIVKNILKNVQFKQIR